MKSMLRAALLGSVIGLGACGNTDPMSDESIHFERNSTFEQGVLTVFLDLQDGRNVSVNTVEDAIATGPFETPLPGQAGRAWTFLKETADGTSIAYSVVTWDDNDPLDYLMAGWWAEFPDQHLPELSFARSERYAIVDGPELDPAFPPDLPLQGQATYVGPAGGLYSYGTEEAGYVIDEYEGIATLTAYFGARTIGGCIGCVGDLITRRAHFSVFLGEKVVDLEATATDYELHLGEVRFDTVDGTFDGGAITVTHPNRTVVASDGSWGGSLSNKPDQAGNPRLVAGFTGVDFEEDNGGEGAFAGTFVAPSTTLTASQQ
ncbi:MAG: hypothetical protein OXI95_14550 [bacterium]|nr:hypothetical protein [bacterium]MDE0418138.1 hypothetical protein [bacterium]